MPPQFPIKRKRLVILVLILAVVMIVAWTAYQFDQITSRSERHNYFYSIDLSYNTTINNVTLLLPVPELNNTPFFIEPLLNGTAYGVPPDWKLTIVEENGTPMLSLRADRMVPEYHGYPIAIEPGVSVLPATRVPAHEYSSDTPVLMPVTITVVETAIAEIDTRHPIGREPLFFPDGVFTRGSGVSPMYNGAVYEHYVPVYISYTSGRPVSVSVRVTVQGINSIWRGGWVSNTYSDTVIIEPANATRGWVEGKGSLFTEEGVYMRT